MRSIWLLAGLGLGCGTSWQFGDIDGDGFTAAQGDCWDRLEGPEGSGLTGDQIHPEADEIWYDGFDSNCAGDDDYDADSDLQVPDMYVGLTTFGVLGSGTLDGGDCWDADVSADIPGDFLVVASSEALNPETKDPWIQPLPSEVFTGAEDTWYDGVDANCDGLDDFDQDQDGYRTSMHPDKDGSVGEDCIDGSILDADNLAGFQPEDVNPGVAEVYYDGTDQDCNVSTVDCDQDGDGALYDGLDNGFCLDENQDCDDLDSSRAPTGEPEIFYNGKDDNCDLSAGDEDGDKDGDGYWASDYLVLLGENEMDEDLNVPALFDDCWDDPDLVAASLNMEPFASFSALTAFQINPGAVDRPYDSVDQDCQGDDDWDWDGDGDQTMHHPHDESTGAVGGDCVDCPTDCGVAKGDRLTYCQSYCAEDFPDLGGIGSESISSFEFYDTPYDGTDQDCDGWNDYDADRDGEVAEYFDGTDCIDGGVWDTDPNPAGLDAEMINSVAVETWYDGTDQNCDNHSDYDADFDGEDTEGHSGGTDCNDGQGVYDDANPGGVDAADINLAASETWYDGTDQNCDNHSDYDADFDGEDTEGTTGGTDCIDGGGTYDDANPAGIAADAVNSGASDTWYDGTDQNCDNNDADVDGDGYYWEDYAHVATIPSDWGTLGGGDCDDDDATVYPSAVEACDGVFNDCNDASWSGSLAPDDETDDDGDDYVECELVNPGAWAGPSSIIDGLDCDDGDATVYPTADELCDGQLNDCEGSELSTESDDDSDGYVECSLDSGGWDGLDAMTGGSDCDPSDGDQFPGADEYCNSEDDDCDGTVDEDASLDVLTWYADSDSDGFGDPASPDIDCYQPSGYVADNTDCDPSDGAQNPDADEYCNGEDDDCDGSTDEDASLDVLTWYEDADSDGYGDASISDIDCYQPSGYVADNTDCDPSDGAQYPGADEYCNGEDDDCDGSTDEDSALDVLTWYADGDSDGYGDPASPDLDCYQPSGYVADNTDCDPTDGAQYPGADEYCNGEDDDCDGSTDEDSALDVLTWFADGDSDGFGDPSSTDIDCNQPSGYVSDNTDCDPADGAQYPGADEYCNGEDDNCDGSTDEDTALDVVTWYEDSDADGFGDPSSTDIDCDPPSGYVTVDTDCNDSDDQQYPGADEYCNGEDDDCDGTTDEDSALDALTWYEDSDGDGYGNALNPTVSCYQPSGYESDDTDCDDNNEDSHPGATEICDGEDNDCNAIDDDDLIGDGDDCPAADCLDILDNRSGASNGIYWIQPDGTAFEALCDLTSDGGGWTLLLAADGSSDYWGNNSEHWYENGADSAPSTLDGDDFHGEAYGDLVTDEIRLCLDMSSCYTFEHELGISLLEFFDSDTSFVDYSDDSLGYSDTGDVSVMDEYLITMDATINVYDCYWLGINYTPAFSGIGLMADANAGCASYTSSTTTPYHDDLAIGLGLNSCRDNNGCTSGGSGHAAGQSRGWDGVDDSGVFGPWYVWAR